MHIYLYKVKTCDLLTIFEFKRSVGFYLERKDQQQIVLLSEPLSGTGSMWVCHMCEVLLWFMMRYLALSNNLCALEFYHAK